VTGAAALRIRPAARRPAGGPARLAAVPSEQQRRRPIGVFDSGVGGLTVLHELLVTLPHEDFLYLGDSARFPYGTRPAQELEGFALHIARELRERGAKLIVVACNSATAAALPALEERHGEAVDVIGVIGPESLQAAVTTRNGRVGLLATPATVASGAYERALHAADRHVRLTSVPCPDLAPIIQSGHQYDERVVEIVRGYCAPLRDAGVDTVILGCTHYPLIRPMIQRMLGRGVTLITPGAAIARRVESALAARGLDSPERGEGAYRFLCTADVESFRALGTRFLQLPLGPVEHVDVHEAETVLLELPVEAR
jgi:glutamate racemase